MPDILGVTNPVPGRENNIINRNLPMSPTQTQVQNVPDPSRVTRADGRSERQDNASEQGAIRYDSNFASFLQKLAGSSELSTVLLQTLSGRMGSVISSGITEGTAAELAELMNMLKMDEGQFAQFLSNQLASGSRLNGPLFSMLRAAYRNADTDSLRGDILQFAKHYSDNSSMQHLENNILNNLNDMTRSIPARYGTRLLELTQQLQSQFASGDHAGALKQLQGQIIPFMSDYVARTHDFGHARDLLTLLTLDISRYESASEENLLQAFRQLKNHPALRETLGPLDDEALLKLAKDSNYAKAAQQNSFADQLASAAARALRGAEDGEVQAAFRELVNAMLVNESVYMQLNHYLIPMEYNGRMMFSELWVDPNDDSGSSARDGEEPGFRFLFKLDIQSLGFFDIVLAYRKESVAIQVQCPEKVAPFTAVIEGGVKDILTRNGLHTDFIKVRAMEKPLTITQVFPKLFERKDSIDVKA